MTNSSSNKRLAVNTVLLYIRMLVLMIVALYTSRVVLAQLGVNDFGIYNVVGGVVAMFSILSGSLTAAISRFITFKLGKGNQEELAKTFSTAINIQVVLAVLIIIIAELIGGWFINYHMTIENSRLLAANWVFQFSLLTFAVQLVSVPYNASIIAHEDMKAFAYISLLEGSLKLAVALLIPLLKDKLIGYAFMLMIVSILIRLLYRSYCRKKYEECHYHFTFDKKLFSEIFSFAGWNFIGASSATLRDQGGNILLNLFFGPAVNAARGLAFQVNAAVSSFINNFMTALNPQITKAYAQGNLIRMHSLVFSGAKFSFFLMLFIALPIYIEIDFVLSLWLREVPAYTSLFVRLIILFSLSESLSSTLITSVLSTGNIKKYQILVGGLQFLNFPVAYILFKLGFPSYSIFILSIVLSQACFFMRMFLLKKLIYLPVGRYLRDVYLRCSLILTSALFFLLKLKELIIATSFMRFLILSLLSSIVIVLAIYYLGCTSKEKKTIRKYAFVLKNKIKL